MRRISATSARAAPHDAPSRALDSHCRRRLAPDRSKLPQKSQKHAPLTFHRYAPGPSLRARQDCCDPTEFICFIGQAKTWPVAKNVAIKASRANWDDRQKWEWSHKLTDSRRLDQKIPVILTRGSRLTQTTEKVSQLITTNNCDAEPAPQN